MPRSSRGMLGVAHREALDVHLVDHRLVPRDLEPAVVAPVEVRLTTTDALERVRRAVLAARSARPGRRLVAEQRRVPVQTRRRARARTDRQQLVRVAAQAARRIPRAVHAEAVALPGPDLGQVRVPDWPVPLVQLDARLARRRRTGTARPARRPRRTPRSWCRSRRRSRRAERSGRARSGETTVASQTPVQARSRITAMRAKPGLR